MKKVIFMIVALTYMAGNMSAQSSSNRIQIGAKAGLNYSNVYDSQGEAYTADGKIGLAGGAFLSIPIGAFLGIQPELLFSQKGFKSTTSVLGSELVLTRTTNYIDLPIFLAVKPNEMFTLLIGPQYSFLISQKDVFKNPISNIVENQDFATDNIRRNTLCLVTGVDINLDRLVLGARVGWDLFDNNGDGTSTNIRYKNVYAQATVGFRL